SFDRLFFFSSRRRHTRSKRDWSSDVCSSDLSLSVVLASAAITATASLATDSLAEDPKEKAVKTYLSSSSAPDDTAVVAYGHPNLIEASGLDPGYRNVWSLPMRVRDPDLDHLVARLSRGEAPTWFIGWNSLNSWDIDEDGRLKRTLTNRYRV